MSRRLAVFFTLSVLALRLAQDSRAENGKPPVAAPERIKKLKVGDPAPELTVKEFVKGDPVKQFEKGKIYVIEFWKAHDTNNYCAQMVPFLTSLQKMYPQIVFIAVGVITPERENQKFMKSFGAWMNYRVAFDAVPADKSPRNEGAMVQGWLLPAGYKDTIVRQERKIKLKNGQNAVIGRITTPVVFIIDGNGKIAWIGEMKQIIEQPQILEKIGSGLATPPQTGDQLHPKKVIRNAVRKLIEMQENHGRWSYQIPTTIYDVIRDGDDLSGGMETPNQVGCTSIVAQTLLLAAANDPNAQAALQRGLRYVLKSLDHPVMKINPGVPDRRGRHTYKQQLWGHVLTLELFCHLRARKMAGEYEKQVTAWIPRLVEKLLAAEISGGGWDYSGVDSHSPSSFTTAVVTQTLLLACAQGEKVPDAVFERARKMLEKGRAADGSFDYSIPKNGRGIMRGFPNSAGRSTLCEATLVLLGSGSTDAVRSALNNFYKHWDDLEFQRNKFGIHQPPYSISPYFFYFGHRYAAQAIQMLPEKERVQQWERLWKLILKTRAKDGSWNDMFVLPGRSYGTAMAILVLLGDSVPLPPKFVATKDRQESKIKPSSSP